MIASPEACFTFNAECIGVVWLRWANQRNFVTEWNHEIYGTKIQMQAINYRFRAADKVQGSNDLFLEGVYGGSPKDSMEKPEKKNSVDSVENPLEIL